jgi:HlyD family secretion protein
MAQAALDLARLSAPFSGTITQVESQPGDLVSGGLLAVKIDDLSRLWVDVEISEVDIRQVAEGQPVSMTFDALPGQTFDGLVSDIAAAGSTVGGTVNFTVRVEIIDPPAEVRPGMTAAVNITVSRLDDVLLVPSRAVRTVDGQRVVYVVRENLPVAVEIGLGASANNYSQVTSGDLKEGDQVILNPSTSTMPVGPIPPGGPGQRNPFGGG